MNFKRIFFVFGVCASLCAQRASAGVLITEWAYQGNGGEFVEFTNTGAAAVNMAGWSFDDNTQTAGSVSLSGFGVVAPGESVILTDLTAAAFRTDWGLSAAAKIIGENTQNLGRADEINLYDSANVRVDWLTYDDQLIGGPRTNTASGHPQNLSAVGGHNVLQWVLSSAGDGYASYTSASGAIGSPGILRFVPEPAGAVLFAVAGFGLFGLRVRKVAWSKSLNTRLTTCLGGND